MPGHGDITVSAAHRPFTQRAYQHLTVTSSVDEYDGLPALFEAGQHLRDNQLTKVVAFTVVVFQMIAIDQIDSR